MEKYALVGPDSDASADEQKATAAALVADAVRVRCGAWLHDAALSCARARPERASFVLRACGFAHADFGANRLVLMR